MRGQRRGGGVYSRRLRIIPARAGPTHQHLDCRRLTPDHPRSCGANPWQMVGTRRSVGSSPLVRGQPDPSRRFAPPMRIIPARAGPTLYRKRTAKPCADHPRSCGANTTTPFTITRLAGSSPLVRVQRSGVRLHALALRIIPARAGPTKSPSPRILSVTDHPRSCGANSYFFQSTKADSGSSPLVRGQLHGLVGVVAHGRIIPARAGPTSTRGVPSTSTSDHPRSCGANWTAAESNGFPVGSSPLVRGQRNPQLGLHAGGRIIPARAGPTNIDPKEHPAPTDHPRSCGANVALPGGEVVGRGSSPLVRGQLPIIARQDRRVRIIPARAGPTRQGHRAQEHAADHPRSCGANRAVSRSMTPGSGSSPLVRGQLRRRPGAQHGAGSSPLVRGQPHDFYEHAETERIIPARAGPTMGKPVMAVLQHGSSPLVRGQPALSSGSLVNATDHPRSCGANQAANMPVREGGGSSPLVRGQHPTCRHSEHQHRIIPARAGPTAPDTTARQAWTDHPRSCGANRARQRRRPTARGSSPLVRGQPAIRLIRGCWARIIPARAGPTVCMS